MRAFVCLLILIAAARAEAASYDFAPVPDLACGTAGGAGRCTVYADPFQSFSYYWSISGTVQVSVYNALGLLVDTYTGNVGANPLLGFSNAVLTAPLGATLTISATMHQTRTLIRSGHNYWRYRDYVDSGSITF